VLIPGFLHSASLRLPRSFRRTGEGGYRLQSRVCTVQRITRLILFMKSLTFEGALHTRFTSSGSMGIKRIPAKKLPVCYNLGASKWVIQGVVEMTTKKAKIQKMKPADQSAEKKTGSFWQSKTVKELVKDQGAKPIKNEEDFTMISGGLEDWDDIDEFLKEVHRPLK
jgi:hypothetical protein